MSFDSLFYQFLLEVINLPALLPKRAVEEIQDTLGLLERCLEIEFSGITPDSFSKESVIKCPKRNSRNIRSLSKWEKEELICAVEKSKVLRDKVKSSKRTEERVLASIDLCQFLTEFIWDYWDALPLKVRKSIVEELRKGIAKDKKLSFWKKAKAFKERVVLFFISLRSGKDLYALRKQAGQSFLKAFLEATKEDIGEVDEKAISALRADISLIQDLEVRKRLELELLNVETFSDLSGLRETVHLLRSPENAKRLKAAMQEVLSGASKPLSLERMRQELGLGEEG